MRSGRSAIAGPAGNAPEHAGSDLPFQTGEPTDLHDDLGLDGVERLPVGRIVADERHVEDLDAGHLHGRAALAPSGGIPAAAAGRS